MNLQVLNKYDVNFFINKKGDNLIDCKNQISSYLYIWRNIDSIDDFLRDINLLLHNKYHLLDDPDYSDSLLNLYGKLTSESIIISEREGLDQTIIPLEEFKELLLSWREFLKEYQE